MNRYGALLLRSLVGAKSLLRARRGAAPDPPAAKVVIFGAMVTEVGRVRATNEDCVAYVTPELGAPEYRKGFLAILADGMGGHAAGEVASALAVEVVRDAVYRLDAPAPQVLATAFSAAHAAIRDHARRNPEAEGMGTTCTALLARDGRLFLAHVGDSRAYLFRDGRLTQLSDDQTLHAHLIRQGLMSQEEAAQSPGANYILQALGAGESITPTIERLGLPIRPGDRLTLCSDGLHALVADAEIARILSASDPHEACRLLVEAANAAGGHDNISVGVFDVAQGATDGGQKKDHADTKPIVVPPALADGSGEQTGRETE
jgi:protein phosphatase